MSLGFNPLSGPQIGIEALRAAKARDLACLADKEALPFTKLLSCHQLETRDVVVIAVEVEVPQRPIHSIEAVEHLALVFDSEDKVAPEVLALREDFPLVPHLNLSPWDTPKSLCIFDERYRDLKPRWTSAAFVERIRTWLRLTARGELHASDQLLEPLFLTTLGTIVIPLDLFEDVDTLPQIFVSGQHDHRGRWLLHATRTAPEQVPEIMIFAATMCCAPRPHGIISHTPDTLEQLSQFLAVSGDDLIGHLREQLLKWREISGALDALMVLVLALPKTRTSDSSTIEVTDTWVFITGNPIRQIGESIGIWQKQGSDIGLIIGSYDERQRGQDIKLGMLNVAEEMTRARAALFNGYPEPYDSPMVAVGAGALGSQVLMNAVRTSFGNWTVIDDDYLLPHNLARHQALGFQMLWSKAQLMAVYGNSLYHDSPIVPIVADVLEPRDKATEIQEAISRATALVDMSASVTVARVLALDVESLGRRISLFLNPSGTDLVLLAEDRDREIRLDAVEMQYYRTLINRGELIDHLHNPHGQMRYGRSCRDVTALLSQELVGLHAAIGARALRAAVNQKSASLRIWRADRETLAVNLFNVSPEPVLTIRCGEWSLVFDEGLAKRLSELRASKLPCETGGVLLGAFDLERKIVYAVDTIPSPPDSTEWPVLYIRGCKGLRQKVESVREITANQLDYIGEWHSHPDGYSCAPSSDDVKVFVWLTERMSVYGLPGFMMIIGEHQQIAPFLGTMIEGESPF